MLQSLPYIIESTKDIDENVRRAAFEFLAEKVHIKLLTIRQRVDVLKRGLGESSDVVRRVVEKEMIPGWLKLSNNSIVQLLHHLDVVNSDQDTKQGVKAASAGALDVLFTNTPYQDLVTSFKYLDMDKFIPYEKLTPEIAVYWRALAEFFAEHHDPEAEEYLESILPELPTFCQYVRRFILEVNKDDVKWEFVAKELISMTTIYDLRDEVGRQNLCKLIKDLLSSAKTPVSFIPTLVTVFTKVEKNAQSRIDQVAEIIFEMKDPLNIDPPSPTSPKYQAAPDTLLKPLRLVEEVISDKQPQIGKLRVEMNLMRDQLDAGTDENILVDQHQLEEEQAMLEEELPVAMALGVAPPASASTAAVPQVEQPVLSDSCLDQVLGNPNVTLKCLRLLVATLQDPSITQLNTTLQILLEECVTISVNSESPEIRTEAITALACCCLKSIQNAKQHMLLLLQAVQIDVTSLVLAPTNSLHLKKVKVLAELLLQNLKEKSCLRLTYNLISNFCYFGPSQVP